MAVCGISKIIIDGKKLTVVSAEATYDNVRILYCGSKRARDWAKENTNSEISFNASFFNQIEGYVNAFHIFNGDVPFNFGETNYEDYGRKALPMGAFAYLKRDENGTTKGKRKFLQSKVATLKEFNKKEFDTKSVIEKNNINFCIGGFDLLLNDNMDTEKKFIGDFGKLYKSYGLTPYIASSAAKVPRTAIGFKDNTVVVIAVFNGHVDEGPTERGDYGFATNPKNPIGARGYEIWKLLRNTYGCKTGLMLDGGGSTQVSYHVNSSDKDKKKAIYVNDGGGERKVYCKIVLANPIDQYNPYNPTI